MDEFFKLLQFCNAWVITTEAYRKCAVIMAVVKTTDLDRIAQSVMHTEWQQARNTIREHEPLVRLMVVVHYKPSEGTGPDDVQIADEWLVEQLMLAASEPIQQE